MKQKIMYLIFNNEPLKAFLICNKILPLFEMNIFVMIFFYRPSCLFYFLSILIWNIFEIYVTHEMSISVCQLQLFLIQVKQSTLYGGI